MLCYQFGLRLHDTMAFNSITIDLDSCMRSATDCWCLAVASDAADDDGGDGDGDAKCRCDFRSARWLNDGVNYRVTMRTCFQFLFRFTCLINQSSHPSFRWTIQPLHQSICLCVIHFIRPSIVNIVIHPLNYEYFYRSVIRFMIQCIRQFINSSLPLSVIQPVILFVRLSICQSFHVSACLSIYPSVHQ